MAIVKRSPLTRQAAVLAALDAVSDVPTEHHITKVAVWRYDESVPDFGGSWGWDVAAAYQVGTTIQHGERPDRRQSIKEQVLAAAMRDEERIEVG